MNLDRHSLGIIISRVLGIYILVHALDFFPLIPVFVRDFHATGFLSKLPLTVAFLAILGMSYFLLAHAPRASRFLMSETHDSPNSGSIDQDSVVRTAFLIIGGFLLVRSFPTFVSQLYRHFEHVIVGSGAVAAILESLVQLLLGLFLVIGGGTFAGLLRRMGGERQR